MDEIFSAAVDEPSSLDYEYSEALLWAEVSYPESFELLPDDIQNQWAEFVTRMACTRYGMTHVVNAQNLMVSKETWTEYVRIIAKTVWEEYLKTNPYAESEWATLQSSLEQFRKNWYCSGYAKVTTVDEIKHAISKWRLIFTGSNNGNWTKVRDEKTYDVKANSSWHAFCIVGYDKEFFYAINSYWNSNWRFAIPVSLIWTTYSKYAVTDVNDERILSDYKKRIMDSINIEDAKKAFESKIWNWTNPTNTATREEVAAMIYRAIESLKNNS